MGKQVKRYLNHKKFLEKRSAKTFTLSNAEDNNLALLSKGKITDLPLLRIMLAIYQSCFIRVRWLRRLKALFLKILDLSKLHLSNQQIDVLMSLLSPRKRLTVAKNFLEVKG